MNRLIDQKPNHSLDELAQGFKTILEKNRELLTVEEMDLCGRILSELESKKIRYSKEKLKEYLPDLIWNVIRVFLNEDTIKNISDFF